MAGLLLQGLLCLEHLERLGGLYCRAEARLIVKVALQTIQVEAAVNLIEVKDQTIHQERVTGLKDQQGVTGQMLHLL